MEIQKSDMTSFLMANIGSTCDVSGAKVKDLMELFQHLRSFIQEYFLEEYHVVDQLVKNSSDDGVERLDLYKEMVIDGSGYIHIIPKISIVPKEIEGQLGEASVVIVEKLVMNDFANALKETDLYSKFTLLDLLECFFVELGHELTQGA